MLRGIEVKKLQYKNLNEIKELDDKKIIKSINLKELLEKFDYENDILYKKNIPTLINLKKDVERYNSATKQLYKYQITEFNHLIGTYFRNNEDFESDLTYVLTFLHKFNNDIELKEYKMDNFLQFNDKNILIKGGPLACYVSHLRAMIYGYQNNTDYTIIIEDDIGIFNTEIIENNINKIPNDWDIISFGCIDTTTKKYEDIIVKFTDTFHSTHFYIVKNKSFDKIFKYFYPIIDQVDILISNMKDKINIYNIMDGAFQLSYSTNTQNNLYCIFTTPNYIFVKEYFTNFEIKLNKLLNTKFDDNVENNKNLSKYIIYDVIYRYITTCDINDANSNIPIHQTIDDKLFFELNGLLLNILNHVKKGSVNDNISKNMIYYIYELVETFNLHNTNDNIKIYAYGSTSNIYKSNDVIIKQYLSNPRWMYKNKNNDIIFKNERDILQNMDNVNIDDNKKIIKMNFKGIPIIYNHILPENWKVQIKNIFDNLDTQNIYYPEFNLFNIVIHNEKLDFIDYGLAKKSTKKNNENYENFIYLITEFQTITDKENILILYLDFMHNMKQKFPKNIY
jgi:GR25 family glycosyltransferase involved in LPS biosynthesis